MVVRSVGGERERESTITIPILSQSLPNVSDSKAAKLGLGKLFPVGNHLKREPWTGQNLSAKRQDPRIEIYLTEP